MSEDTPLPDNSILWRYMSFTKLVALFSQEALFFSRCDAFDDPFEGALSPNELKDSIFEGYDNAGKIVGLLMALALVAKKEGPDSELSKHLSEVAKTLGGNLENIYQDVEYWNRVTNGDPNEVLRQIHDRLPALMKKWASEDFKREWQSTFISCWHHATHESEAMWRLYARETVEGVAIQTTVERLKAALPQDKSFMIRAVDYRDNYVHNKREESLARFFIKRKAFEHEKEVRVLLSDNEAGQKNQRGIRVPTRLSELIQTIVVSPYAPDWLPGVVSDTVERFGINATVSHSELRREPFHF